MTTKKTEAKKEVKKEEEATASNKKLTLFDAVQKSKVKNFVIVGALSKAGLLEQYRKEEAENGIEDIEPSITMTELNKIIKNFTG